MQTKSANHAASTGHAQEKSARSYELEFFPNLKFVNSKLGAHFGWPVTDGYVILVVSISWFYEDYVDMHDDEEQ